MVVTTISSDRSEDESITAKSAAESVLKSLEDQGYNPMDGRELMMMESRSEDNDENSLDKYTYRPTQSFEETRESESPPDFETKLSRDWDYYTTDGSQTAFETVEVEGPLKTGCFEKKNGPIDPPASMHSVSIESRISMETDIQTKQEEKVTPSDSFVSRISMETDLQTKEEEKVIVASTDKVCAFGTSDNNITERSSSSCNEDSMYTARSTETDIQTKEEEKVIATSTDKVRASGTSDNNITERSSLDNEDSMCSTRSEHSADRTTASAEPVDEMGIKPSVSWGTWAYSTMFGSVPETQKPVKEQTKSPEEDVGFSYSTSYASSIEVSVDSYGTIEVDSFTEIDSQVHPMTQSIDAINEDIKLNIEHTVTSDSSKWGLWNALSNPSLTDLPNQAEDNSHGTSTSKRQDLEQTEEGDKASRKKRLFKSLFGALKVMKIPSDAASTTNNEQTLTNFDQVPEVVRSSSSGGSSNSGSYLPPQNSHDASEAYSTFKDPTTLRSYLPRNLAPAPIVKETPTRKEVATLASASKEDIEVVYENPSKFSLWAYSFSDVETEGEKKKSKKFTNKLKKFFRKRRMNKKSHKKAIPFQGKKIIFEEIQTMAEKEIQENVSQEGLELIAGVTKLGKKAIAISQTEKHPQRLYEA